MPLQEFQKTFVEYNLDRIANHILERVSGEASLASKWHDGPPEKAPFSPERLAKEITTAAYQAIKPTIDQIVQEFHDRDRITLDDIREALIQELQLDRESFAIRHQNHA